MSPAQILSALTELLRAVQLPWWGSLLVIVAVLVAFCVAVFIVQRPGMLKHRPGVIDAETRSRAADFLMSQENPDLERLIRLCRDPVGPELPPTQGPTVSEDVTNQERRPESPP